MLTVSQTHTNNPLVTANEWFGCVWPFCWVGAFVGFVKFFKRKYEYIRRRWLIWMGKWYFHSLSDSSGTDFSLKYFCDAVVSKNVKLYSNKLIQVTVKILTNFSWYIMQCFATFLYLAKRHRKNQWKNLFKALKKPILIKDIHETQ